MEVPRVTIGGQEILRSKEMTSSSKAILDAQHQLDAVGNHLLVLKTKQAAVIAIKGKIQNRLLPYLTQLYFEGYKEGDADHGGQQLYTQLEDIDSKLALYVELNKIIIDVVNSPVEMWEPQSQQMLGHIQALEDKHVKVAKYTIISEMLTKLCKWHICQKEWTGLCTVLSKEKDASLGVQACHLDDNSRVELQVKVLPKCATDLLTQPSRDGDAMAFIKAYGQAPTMHLYLGPILVLFKIQINYNQMGQRNSNNECNTS